MKEHRTKVSIFWETVTRHSAEYMRVLQLSEQDLEALEDVQGHAGMLPTLEDHAKHSFLQLKVDDRVLSLYVKNVCGSYYGDTWKRCIMAFSPIHPDLNQECGYGTTHIVYLPQAVHSKLILELRN